MNRIYYAFRNHIRKRAERAGVAQLGQSVRLIIERSRAQVPPPAYDDFLHYLLFAIVYCKNDKHHNTSTITKISFNLIDHTAFGDDSFKWESQDRCQLSLCLILRIIILFIFSQSQSKFEFILHEVSLSSFPEVVLFRNN